MGGGSDRPTGPSAEEEGAQEESRRVDSERLEFVSSCYRIYFSKDLTKYMTLHFERMLDNAAQQVFEPSQQTVSRSLPKSSGKADPSSKLDSKKVNRIEKWQANVPSLGVPGQELGMVGGRAPSPSPSTGRPMSMYSEPQSMSLKSAFKGSRAAAAPSPDPYAMYNSVGKSSRRQQQPVSGVANELRESGGRKKLMTVYLRQQ